MTFLSHFLLPKPNQDKNPSLLNERHALTPWGPNRFYEIWTLLLSRNLNWWSWTSVIMRRSTNSCKALTSHRVIGTTTFILFYNPADRPAFDHHEGLPIYMQPECARIRVVETLIWCVWRVMIGTYLWSRNVKCRAGLHWETESITLFPGKSSSVRKAARWVSTLLTILSLLYFMNYSTQDAIREGDCFLSAISTLFYLRRFMEGNHPSKNCRCHLSGRMEITAIIFTTGHRWDLITT